MRSIPLLIPSMPSAESIAHWLRVIDQERRYTNFGPLIQTLERKILELFPDNTYGITTTANATLGLELALSALKLPAGSKVLVPALTFPASASAIHRAGLVPVISDIDLENWSLTPRIAEQALAQEKISAVMPVSTYGFSHAPGPWDAFIERFRIPVVIDAAGAFGNQQPAAKAVTVFSLHATKALGCGEGGFILSRDDALIKRIRQMSNFGIGEGGLVTDSAGTNAKLSEYHAAVGLAALESWEEKQTRYRELFTTYMEQLHRYCPDLKHQQKASNGVYPIMTVCLPANTDATRIGAILAEDGIETRRWYCPPLHLHPAFENCPKSCDLEVVNSMWNRLLGLPFHLFLSESDITLVCRTLGKALATKA